MSDYFRSLPSFYLHSTAHLGEHRGTPDDTVVGVNYLNCVKNT